MVWSTISNAAERSSSVNTAKSNHHDQVRRGYQTKHATLQSLWSGVLDTPTEGLTTVSTVWGARQADERRVVRAFLTAPASWKLVDTGHTDMGLEQSMPKYNEEIIINSEKFSNKKKILLALRPQAARAGARTRLVLSPTPPVLCLSTTRCRHLSGQWRTRPDDAMHRVSWTVSSSVMPHSRIAISSAPVVHTK